MNYRGRRVIVTGGLGFIGSNLVVRLAEAGALVTIIDSMLDGCGGNLHNIAPVRDAVRVISADIGDAHMFRDQLADADIIFNLAGEISHVHSMEYPERDLQVNAVSQLRFLIACRDSGTRARVVYAGTRQVYGAPQYLPVDEDHPIQPIDFNGVHKFAATAYHLMLARAGQLDACVVRLTNVYGPRMALDVVCQGVLSTFVRRMVLRQQIEIYGDGAQLRDPMFVDDAVDAFLLLGAAESLPARVYNTGGPEVLSVNQIARCASEIAGCSDPVFRPFPEDRKSIDIGSYYTDGRRIQADYGWRARVALADGLRRTLEFFRQEVEHYLDPAHPNPPCRMPEHTGSRRALRYVPLSAGTD